MEIAGVRGTAGLLGERRISGGEVFAGVSAETLHELNRRCRWIELNEGVVLVPAGDPLDRVFVVVRGELRFSLYTSRGSVVWLRGADQGSLVSEAAFIDTAATRYSIEAGRPSTVASISAWAFIELIERDRNLLNCAIRSLVARQEMLADQIVELTTLNVEARIHNELLRLARDNIAEDGSATISPFPTHADFARRIGTHREAVSRELSHLQHIGAVVRGDKRLTIPDVTRLGLAPF